MSIDYSQMPISKGEPRVRTKRRKEREHADHVAAIRTFVFGRERGLCRICRIRPAESMHELTPRSLGGHVSKKNSIAICGQIVGAVPSCHTYIQAREIQWMETPNLGAQGPLVFTPSSQAAADWLHVAIGQSIHSEPLAVYERESA